MADLKGSKTEKNLETAFAGESMARNKYTYFASKARKDGYVQIANIFEETANNEKEHAKMWFKLLNDGIGSTAECLLAAAEGENYEWTDMYANFAKEAKEEALLRSPDYSKALPRLKKSMRIDTESFLQMWKEIWYSPRTAMWFGSVPTADISA